MALYTRDTLPTLLADLAQQPVQVYFLFGERYLCHNAAGQIETALLQDGGTVHPIDGDQEDIQATLSKLRSFSLFPGRQIYRVTDTRLFHSRMVVKNIWDRVLKAHTEQKKEQAVRALRSMIDAGGLDLRSPDIDLAAMSQSEWQHCFGFARPAGDLSWTGPLLATENTRRAGTTSAGATDPAEALTKILASGIPQDNILLLLSEEADKRKKLFKLLKEEQVVVDLSVETGAGTKAQKEQRSVLNSLVQQTLAEQNKTMAASLNEILFERVGFHPVAVVMELRKVMLSIGDRRQITRDDLDTMVGRTRQEALFELTGAITSRNLEQTLTIGSRLEENGVHPLAVVATLRNFVRACCFVAPCRTSHSYVSRRPCPPPPSNSTTCPC